MFVGWDWASATHDVTVLDDAGAWSTTGHSPHTEAGPGGTLNRLARWRPADELPVIIERAGGWSWIGCWPPVTRWCRSSHRFYAARPRWGAAGANPIPATATSSLTTCAPTAIGCAGWSPGRRHRELQALVRLREDQVTARPRPATSSAPCSRRTGPGQGDLLPARLRGRPGVPDRLPDPRGRCPARRGPSGRLLPPPRYLPAAAPPSC